MDGSKKILVKVIYIDNKRLEKTILESTEGKCIELTKNLK